MTVQVLLAVALRPGLWRIGLVELLRSAVPRWWRRWPFLPLPAPRWVEFRLECATGRSVGPLEPRDVVEWLKWCKQMQGRPG